MSVVIFEALCVSEGLQDLDRQQQLVDGERQAKKGSRSKAGKMLLFNEKKRRAKLEELMGSMNRCYNETVVQGLQQHDYNFVLSDPRLPNNPIVYASEGFCKMSGYECREVLGRNCRFLQGPDTDRRTVLEIRDAIREERPCQVRILNYTKQGEAFWNLFHLAPVYSRLDGNVIHFVGVQTPMSLSLAAVPAPSIRGSRLVSDRVQEVPQVDKKINSFGIDEYVNLSPPGNESSCRVPDDAADFSSEGEAENGRPARNLEIAEDTAVLRVQGGAGEEEEDTPEIKKADQERAAFAVRAILCQLAESSKIKGGLVEKRCTGLSEGAARGVVCSSLMLSLTQIQQSFVLVDPNLPDMPIVHASDGFCELTGYSQEEVVGHNCRFLQGPDTDPVIVQQIRDSIEAKRPCTVRILNYRKDKRPFWNHLHISPVRSACGKVAFFVGVQLDVSAADDLEDNGMTAHMKQLSAVGAVRVAVRSLQGSGLRRAPRDL
uniref:Putative LOV domain-containing protein n=1 Tax=Takakia lepidozioides TaxID=37425 RepID=A0A126X1K2_TAKLE|nr:putative LOV domain-containing protein [Takakia lepidozioides]